MSNKKKLVRALQERTGWSYQRCFNILQLHLTPEALEQYIRLHGGEKKTEP